MEMSRQFEELGLFPKSDPAMREAHPAEQRLEQFEQRPDVMFHATHLIHPSQHHLPVAMDIPHEHLTEAQSAGIHLGTARSAEERALALGPHEHTGEPSRSFAAVVHPMNPVNSPADPTHDRGDDWRFDEIQAESHWPDLEPDELLEMEEHREEGGEYYENQMEDPGSISARVPSRDDISTLHDFAMQSPVGQVHPQTRYLMHLGVRHHNNPAFYLGQAMNLPDIRAAKKSRSHYGLLYQKAEDALLPASVVVQHGYGNDRDQPQFMTHEEAQAHLDQVRKLPGAQTMWGIRGTDQTVRVPASGGNRTRTFHYSSSQHFNRPSL